MITEDGSQRVSPVVTDFNPTAAAISPALTSFISSLEFECICKILPILSFFCVTALYTVSPAFKTPEYTLKNASVPTKGSVAILNARDANGSSSDEFLTPSEPSESSFIPLIAGTSKGEGINSITASSIACTPLFLKAVPQVTSTISLARVCNLNPSIIFSIDNSPLFKYSSINSSFASAAVSTSCSCNSSDLDLRSSGISTVSNFIPLDSSSQIIAFILNRSTTPLKLSSDPMGT